MILSYYQGLQKCLGLYAENALYSPDEIERLDALYKSLGQKYSWSSAVKVTYSFQFKKHVLYLCLLLYLLILLLFRNILYLYCLEISKYSAFGEWCLSSCKVCYLKLMLVPQRCLSFMWYINYIQSFLVILHSIWQ